MTTSNTHGATLTILYSEQPGPDCNRFFEVRRWESDQPEYAELVVECGALDEEGNLKTECRVMPFYFTLLDVMTEFTVTD